MKKRLFSLLLTLCMVLSLLPFPAAAADIVASGTCGENLTWTLDSNGLLLIQGKGEMYSSPWCSDWHDESYEASERIKTVVIRPGVTNIDALSFFHCTNLKSITIPDTVTKIGMAAFVYCSGLRTVTLPDSVTEIQDHAFQDCTALKSVKIPNGVTRIAEYTFTGCTSLKGVSLPDSVTSIGERAFGDCTGLTSIEIPDSVTSIGYNAFERCSSLMSVTLPDSVSNISARAFLDCSSLTSIVIPDRITTIEDGVFSNCTSLREVTLPSGLKRIGAASFSSCGLQNIVIPDGVEAIGRAAFAVCRDLERVNIPKSVKTLGDYVFEGCMAMNTVTVDDANPCYCSIDGVLFDKSAKTLIYCPCAVKDRYVVPDGVETLYSGAIRCCVQLNSVSIPDGLTTIGEYAFAECENLKSIRIPSTVTDIGLWAFHWTDALQDVWYAGTEAEWNAIRIDDGNEPLLNATVHFGAPYEKLFSDVANDPFYFEPVIWAVYHDPAITMGTDATHFSPDATCTRAQAVTFLWRAMDCPEPATTENPFTDVSETDWYYKPVLWAAENSITSGVGGGRFDPDGVCNRSQIVTFLWRATKPHEAQSAGSAFSDVPAAEWFAEPVAWAVEKGITYGIGNGKFGPFLDCTRGQIVTFLYRCMK